ncbi:MAG TPA: hypothetical protein VF142_05010 [Longimicrobium sp.]
MNKLKLHLDELVVESFDTAGRAGEKGTVFGEQCTCPTACTCPGCETCDYTCDDPTCVGQTCDGYTCEGSCPLDGCALETRFCPPF